jgi:hypothetical protein
MVAENSSGRNAQGGRSFDVVMLDWADAGWYPQSVRQRRPMPLEETRQIFFVVADLIVRPLIPFNVGLDGGCLHHYMFHNQRGGLPRSLGPYIGEANFVAGIVGNRHRNRAWDTEPVGDYRISAGVYR